VLPPSKETARSIGQAMSTLVVQEHHLWLNLADMRDTIKNRFLDAPLSQVWLFGDVVDSFAPPVHWSQTLHPLVTEVDLLGHPPLL